MLKENVQNILKTSKSLKVLYVEDNKDARESTFLILQNYFDYIEVAVDGIDALERYNNYFYETNSYFDIVFSDIEMPNLDGVGLTKEIYNINKKQFIVIISAYSDKEYLIPLLNLGVEGFIQKPIIHEQVMDVVKDICNLFNQSDIVDIGESYTYDKNLNILMKDDKYIKLTNNEIKLLKLFFDNLNTNFNIEYMFNHIFYDDPHKEYNSNSIRLILKRLRKKLPDGLIINNRTLGYTINLL